MTSQRWFFKSLAIIEPRGDSENLVRLYRWISRSGFRQGDYKKTVQYAQLALHTARRIKSETALARAYRTIGDIYERDWSEGGKKPDLPKANLDSTRYYRQFDEAILSVSTKPLDILNRHLETGQKLWYEKKDTTAMIHLRKALSLAMTEEKSQYFTILLAMAVLYSEMGKLSQASHLLLEAERHLKNSTYANSYSDRMLLQLTYRNFYLKTGDWKKAYEYGEKVHELERNNYITDRDGAVTRLSLEFETEKKEALLKAQQKELVLRSENLQVQQRFIATMIALLLILAVMSIVFYRLYRKNQRISIRNEALVKEQNHRVKNNLQVISSLLNLQANRLTDSAAKRATEVSQLRIETMAILHRRLYDNDTLTQINLAEFIPELVENVLLSFGYPYIQPVYEVEPIGILADLALPLGLILNELATNACKYAFADHQEPAFRITCQQQKNRIYLRVADNGPGLAQVPIADLSAKTHQSFGMRLIQIQVAQLRGTYSFKNQSGTVFNLNFTVVS
ncbi:sensor histidine kinase [Spirosoma flavus]